MRNYEIEKCCCEKRLRFALILVGLCCALLDLELPQAQPATQHAATGPKAFDTPQQAADALIKAAGDYDVPELLAILGPDGQRCGCV